MNFKLLIAIILLPMTMLAQEKKSKGDEYFYGYQYKNAIAEYNKERVKRPLANEQILNLADSYFKIGDYNNASKLYLIVHKNDTIMSGHRFNKMLQSLSKNSGKERIKTFLRSKSPSFSKELLENAEFNDELFKNSEKGKNIEIVNLYANSPQADFSPAFYKESLLFSSSRTQKAKKIYAPSGESYLDIYVGRLENNGNVSKAVPFSKIPDSKFHKSTPYFSEELNRFFYILSNTEDGQMTFDDKGKNALSIGMLYDSGQFRFLLKDLSTSFYYPYFDEENDRLYFAANFEDSYGGTDLYYVFTNNGQIMSAPINLGPRINSPGNEIAPYLFEGSLYFSSDVFYGLGGMDVYKSNIQADGSLSIPVNIGENINSKADDFGFIIKEGSDNGYVGYFASNRSGGKGGDDIYKFKMDKAPGLRTFSLKGKVVNLSSKVGIDKAQIRLLDRKGDILKEFYTAENGDFTIEIPWQEQITIQATKERYSIFSTTYTEEGMEEAQKTSFNMGLAFLDDLIEEKEGKTVIKIGKFYFDKGKSTVTPSVAAELDKVVDAVSRFPQLQLKIESHTDSRGSSASNKQLSQKRSDAIKIYLLKNGLSISNILESIGYGEERIKNNCTNGAYCLDFLHKQNERTLFVIGNQ
ncbi:OmpA family protein [Maribacter sp. 2304DJ31-5]|uniref:OmpA family protein n=1 Tax=Maribacter sp. 2304DJ31-5 TaxID=3386273 RepID=UPI0039BCE59F